MTYFQISTKCLLLVVSVIASVLLSVIVAVFVSVVIFVVAVIAIVVLVSIVTWVCVRVWLRMAENHGRHSNDDQNCYQDEESFAGHIFWKKFTDIYFVFNPHHTIKCL